MKNIIIALIVGTFLYACQPTSTSEQPDTDAVEASTEIPKDGFYGAAIDVYNVEDVSVLHGKLANQDSVMTKVSGTILQTCANKGCWMKVAMADGDTLRVTFKDYGFFVPKEGMEGKQVLFEGLAKKDVTSIETLQHYAKDGGASEDEIALITEPKEEVSFVASGVMIKEVE